jgi:CarD family transcriptional regulator
VEEPGNWSRRFKANTEKMGSGNVLRISEVVRDLWRRDRERGVSAGEKAMLAKARRNLVSELLLALHLTAEQTEAVLDEVLESAVAETPSAAKASA